MHTKRAVCRVSETWTESQSTLCRSSQARYSAKSSPTAPTRIGRQAQVAEAEADVGRATAAAYFQVLDEERHRQLVELVDHEAVGELAREGHQVVGRDGSGYEKMDTTRNPTRRPPRRRPRRRSSQAAHGVTNRYDSGYRIGSQ